MDPSDWNEQINSIEQIEIRSYAFLINDTLKNDKYVKELPINPEDDSLFQKIRNGVIFIKLLNKCEAGTIDERVVNRQKRPMNIFQKQGNLTLAIQAAKSIGLITVGYTRQTLYKPNQLQVMGLLYQIFLKYMSQKINLADHPGLYKLLRPGETLADLKALSVDELLLRWFNYHLKRAGSKRTVENFNKDIKDGENYTVLLHQLNSELCDDSGLKDKIGKRCQKVLDNADKLGAVKFLDKPKDIISGDSKLNRLFCASIFNACSGLDDSPIPSPPQELIEPVVDDDGDPREERAFKNWINSLGIDGVHVNDIKSDLQDGKVLLKVLERVKPGSVNWKKVEKCKNKGQRQYINRLNCAYAVKVGKEKLGLKFPNTGGEDISKRNMTITLGALWQIIMFYYQQLYGEMNEKKLIKWGNSLADVQISKFNDKKIKDSKWILQVLDKTMKHIKSPFGIDDEIIEHGKDNESRILNGRYAITTAMMLGCTVFITPEDILDRKKRMIFTLVGGINYVYHHGEQEEMVDVNLVKGLEQKKQKEEVKDDC